MPRKAVDVGAAARSQHGRAAVSCLWRMLACVHAHTCASVVPDRPSMLCLPSEASRDHLTSVVTLGVAFLIPPNKSLK